MKTEKLTRLALLTAIASVIFIVELQFPDLIPITGVKAGLANIITVYVLYKYNWQDAVLVTLARIIIELRMFLYTFSADARIGCQVMPYRNNQAQMRCWLNWALHDSLGGHFCAAL